jgi:hypothetical protein
MATKKKAVKKPAQKKLTPLEADAVAALKKLAWPEFCVLAEKYGLSRD